MGRVRQAARDERWVMDGGLPRTCKSKICFFNGSCSATTCRCARSMVAGATDAEQCPPSSPKTVRIGSALSSFSGPPERSPMHDKLSSFVACAELTPFCTSPATRCSTLLSCAWDGRSAMCESDDRLRARPTAQNKLKQTNEHAALNIRVYLFGGSALGRCNSGNKLWLAPTFL